MSRLYTDYDSTVVPWSCRLASKWLSSGLSIMWLSIQQWYADYFLNSNEADRPAIDQQSDEAHNKQKKTKKNKQQQQNKNTHKNQFLHNYGQSVENNQHAIITLSRKHVHVHVLFHYPIKKKVCANIKHSRCFH